MKNSIMAAFLGVVFIIWNLLIAFGLWGGKPEGAFVKINRLEAQVEEQSEQLKFQTATFNKRLEPKIIPEYKKWRLNG